MCPFFCLLISAYIFCRDAMMKCYKTGGNSPRVILSAAKDLLARRFARRGWRSFAALRMTCLERSSFLVTFPHRVIHHYFVCLMMRLPIASTRPVHAGGTTVVVSYCVIMAGPAMVAPA